MANIGGVGGGPRPAEEIDAATASGEARAASAAPAPAQGPLIERGARGPVVARIQTLLRDAGYDIGRFGVDGAFGNDTARAVAAFQRTAGLPATARVDDATFQALQKAAAAKGGGPSPAEGGIPPEKAVASFKLGNPGGDGSGAPLIATINGRPVQLADDALQAKLLSGGRYLVWSNPQGAGGYENEGQGLSLYDAKTGKTRQVLSEYYMIDDFRAAKLPDGRDALLVSMSDGGLGAPHFAVVDPERGEVFRLERASFVKVDEWKIRLGLHENVDDIEDPTRYQTFDLRKILSGPVITNPPDHL